MGVFVIEGRLRENSCGNTAVAAQDPLHFNVELRTTEHTIYWKHGRQLIAGTREGSTFSVETARNVSLIPTDRARQIVGCAVRQDETIRGALREASGDAGVDRDATAPDASSAIAYGMLEGDNEIAFVPVPGSDCQAALATHGGPWLALPCRLRYDITGARDAD